ncbi:SDR family NAD(P)-dependent oxidoreductase [Peristeroidobacter agariperforans]|uniref:SDR family NAD(P)-dependent oxidoreductase n=1 Tax=Peristeroidobacter agariperforans TaxID=268404 RepID=UPI00130046D4|nr:SDR family oxidoreductase [Peristeroidobacter agariperforans]
MYRDLFDVSGRKALVTGGAIGVGRACAVALASSGVDVALAGRNAERGERTCESLRQMGVDSFFIKCDVADPRQIHEMQAEVARRFGRLDIAVNNAGGGIAQSALEMDSVHWDQMIDINLAGVFWCAQAQAKQMMGQEPCGGKIINIASMYGRIAAGNCAYNASKAAVIHLTRTLAVEWGSYNINVNCISPGWMLTHGNPVDPEWRARMREVTPMGSLIPYSAMYGAVLFLASAASDLVTGLDLLVDGGHTLSTYLHPLHRAVPARISPKQEEAGREQDPL